MKAEEARLLEAMEAWDRATAANDPSASGALHPAVVAPVDDDEKGG